MPRAARAVRSCSTARRRPSGSRLTTAPTTRSCSPGAVGARGDRHRLGQVVDVGVGRRADEQHVGVERLGERQVDPAGVDQPRARDQALDDHARRARAPPARRPRRRPPSASRARSRSSRRSTSSAAIGSGGRSDGGQADQRGGPVGAGPPAAAGRAACRSRRRRPAAAAPGPARGRSPVSPTPWPVGRRAGCASRGAQLGAVSRAMTSSSSVGHDEGDGRDVRGC